MVNLTTGRSTRFHGLRSVLCAAVILAVSGAAAASPGGYVYVAVPAAACAQASPCGPPQLMVLDGVSAAVVTTIDLPVHTQPRGIAISRDGAHLYVSNAGVEFGASTSITIIDARHHSLVTSVALPADTFGGLAVRANGTRVYIAVEGISPDGQSRTGPPRLDAFDTAPRTIAASVTLSVNPASNHSVAYSAVTDDVYVLSSSLTRYDGDTLAPQDSATVRQYTGPIGVSSNGDRLYATNFGSDAQPLNGGSIAAFDPVTLSRLYDWPLGAGSGTHVAAVEVPRRDEVLVPRTDIAAAGRSMFLNGFTAASGQTTRSVRSPQVPDFIGAAGLAVTPDGARAMHLTRRSGESGQLDVLDLASNTWNAGVPLPRAASLIATTPAGAPSCSYQLDSHSASFSRTGAARPFNPIDGSARILVTTDCAFSVSADASWIGSGPFRGSGSRFVGIGVEPQLSTAPTRRGHLVIGGQVVLVTQAGASSSAPTGFVDTPADFASGLGGAIAVTGWAVDDIAVERISIFRDRLAGEGAGSLVLLGDATQVEGARPDVQALFPASPFSSRAGWGYQLLTNALPGGGNGTFRLFIYAADLEGNDTLLGSRTFTARNATSTTPFGAIDTPGQGSVLVGVMTNWGWALTPQPANIPADGSTIDVILDGVVVGHPTYGLFRSDVAAQFPGYANSQSAVGYFTIDTRTLTNGLHSIAWVVRDSLGRAQGIGSRYFTVQNP